METSLDEIRKQKRIMEKDIADLVSPVVERFCRRTGLAVSDISLRTQDVRSLGSKDTVTFVTGVSCKIDIGV